MKIFTVNKTLSNLFQLFSYFEFHLEQKMSLKDGSEDELDLEQSLFEDEANDSTSNWKPIDHVIHDTLELDTLESNSEKEKTEVGPKGWNSLKVKIIMAHIMLIYLNLNIIFLLKHCRHGYRN